MRLDDHIKMLQGLLEKSPDAVMAVESYDPDLGFVVNSVYAVDVGYHPKGTKICTGVPTRGLMDKDSITSVDMVVISS